MMKIHVKSFYKQVIEEQLILKFRLFLYGNMSRLDDQN